MSPEVHTQTILGVELFTVEITREESFACMHSHVCLKVIPSLALVPADVALRPRRRCSYVLYMKRRRIVFRNDSTYKGYAQYAI